LTAVCVHLIADELRLVAAAPFVDETGGVDGQSRDRDAEALPGCSGYAARYIRIVPQPV